MPFNTVLRELRKKKELTQGELAKLTGLTVSAISMYETGQREPSFEVLETLADFFNVDMNRLLGTQAQETPPRRKAVKIPIYGSIVAGVPETAEQDILGWFEIPEELAERGDYYMLKVHGMSMSPDICDGDYVLVRQQETARSGDICVINVNGDECTLKEIQITPEGVLLVGYNQAEYKPKFYTNEEVERLPLRIQGVVIQCIRKYKEY